MTTAIYKTLARLTFDNDFIDLEFRNAQIRYQGRDYTTLPSLIEGNYEASEFNRVLQLIGESQDEFIVYDIGANVGIWTCVLALHPNVSHVVAFEPSAENLHLLEFNVNSNECSEKVTIVDAAVSNFDGFTQFSTSGNGATRRIVSPRDGRPSSEVKVVSLDTFLERDGRVPKLIKIDVEGFEPLVLDGMKALLKEHQPALLLEYSSAQSESAKTSWEVVGRSLIELYGFMEIIDQSTTEIAEDFGALKNDSRLINLLFVPAANALRD